MSTATTNMGLTKPDTTDPADIAVLNENMDKLDGHRHLGGNDGLPVKAVQSGPLSGRPTDVTAGQLYVDTDTSSLHLANGTAWSQIGAQAGNLLANGGFEVWQRGDGPFTAHGAITSDEVWITKYGTSTISVSKESSIVDERSQHSVAATVTYDGTNTTACERWLSHTDKVIVAGQILTHTIRVRAAAVGAVRVRVQAWDTGWANRVYDLVSNPNVLANEWETITTLIELPASARFLGIYTEFLGTGTHYIDNEMLVYGSARLRYVPLHPADELARCQRYYEVHFGVLYNEPFAMHATAGGGGQNIGVWQRFSTRKTTTPTVTKNGTWAVTNCGQPASWAPSPDGYHMWVQPSGAGRTNIYCDSTDDTFTAEAHSW